MKNIKPEQFEDLISINPHGPCTRCVATIKRHARTIAGDVLRALKREPRTANEIAADIGRSAKQVRSRMRALNIARVGGGYAAVAS